MRKKFCDINKGNSTFKMLYNKNQMIKHYHMHKSGGTTRAWIDSKYITPRLTSWVMEIIYFYKTEKYREVDFRYQKVLSRCSYFQGLLFNFIENQRSTAVLKCLFLYTTRGKQFKPCSTKNFVNIYINLTYKLFHYHTTKQKSLHACIFVTPSL